MIADVKDNIANATTLAGTGSALMGVNELLTLMLIITGIVLNVVRIVAIKRKKDEQN